MISELPYDDGRTYYELVGECQRSMLMELSSSFISFNCMFLIFIFPLYSLNAQEAIYFI